MEIAGYIAAIFVGLVLGLIGAGGAILTVPIMVYLMDIDPVLATVYSLFIVGTTTLIGSFSYVKNGLVSFKTSLAFAIPSLISIFMTRKFLLPSIPDILYSSGEFVLTKNHFVLFFFAIIMLLSSISMIFGNVKEKETGSEMTGKEIFTLVFYGLFVGVVTGLVGAGGGFLIVPALVFFAKVPVKAAVGTSLLIIAINSLTGFAGDLMGEYIIDWKLLIVFLGFAIAGIFLGSYLTKFISGKSIKKSFGWFVLIMGIYIIIRELNSF
ncbi:MAG TPA: sulfite exporter TauE/SafE family protein [Ignavibacteria bacterium]|nr:sulfite exporter TauE/SafE family protein [Ignavibacteria bacterium]HMR39427.1 sulfite exporter TauE/SafE family protein [Ignavibacteria bacterium]